MSRKVEVIFNGTSFDQNFFRIVDNHGEVQLDKLPDLTWHHTWFGLDLSHKGVEYLEFEFRSQGIPGDKPTLTIKIDDKTPPYTYNDEVFDTEGLLVINDIIMLEA